MPSQLFKSKIPDAQFIYFLDSVCVKTDRHYTLNKDDFKRGVFNDTIQQFLVDCIPFYHISKRAYLEKKLTYNSFTTVLRQICKHNSFTYTSQIQYDRSIYNIIYFIFYKT